MAKAFISYSRKNIEFAKKLTAELSKSELDFWVDWEGIPPTVDWWREIEKGIEEADIFLFLISPDSSASKVCGQEIDHAIKNSKRIIPLVVKDIQEGTSPKKLSHLNWIFFREQDDFNEAIQKLMTAIHTDYEWVQTHRRLQMKALEWERGGKDQAFLLRGRDLEDAESDLALNTSKEPHPSNLQREYVFASRKLADRQRRTVMGFSIAGVVALAALAVFGLVQAGLAKAEARRATAGQLALESKTALLKYPQRAMLLALESVRISQEANEPIPTESEEALRLAVERVSGYGLTGFKYEPSFIQFTKDSKWLVAGTQYGGEVGLWNVQKAADDPAYQPFLISFELDPNGDDIWDVENGLIQLSADETWLMVNAIEGASGLWKVDAVDENRSRIPFDGRIGFLDSTDENIIVEKLDEEVAIWRVDPASLTKTELSRLPGRFISTSDNGKYLLVNNPSEGLQLWETSQTPAVMLSTFAEPGLKFTFANFASNGRWFFALEEVAHPELMIDSGYYDDNAQWVDTSEPWKSNTIWVFSLENPAASPEMYAFDFSINNGAIYASPDGTKFSYQGYYASNEYTSGYLDLSGNEPVNTVMSADMGIVSYFIGNHFLYFENYGVYGVAATGFLDLRDMSVVDNPDMIFNPFPEINYSDNNRYVGVGELMLDVQALEENAEVIMLPIQASLFKNLREEKAQSEFEIALRANPLAYGLEDYVSLTATSPDDRWFVAGAGDGSLRLWDNFRPFGDTRITLPIEERWYSAMAFSNDNRWLVADDVLWVLEDGKPIQNFPLAPKDWNTLISVFSPDARWLATISLPVAATEEPQTNLTLVDLQQTLETGEIVQINNLSMPILYGASAIQFSADSRWMFVQQDQSILYDLEKQKTYTFDYFPSQAVFMEDQSHFILIRYRYDETSEYMGSEAEIFTLPIAGGNYESVATFQTGNQTNLYASQNGRWLVSIPTYEAPDLREVNLWSVDCILKTPACAPQVFQADKAAFSRDSKTFVTALSQNDEALAYEVWNIENETPQMKFSGNAEGSNLMLGNTAQWLIFSKQATEGKAFLSSSWVNTYYNFVTTFDGYGVFSLSGGGGGGGGIGTYQIDYFVNAMDGSGKQTLKLRGHESNVSTNIISPDERYMVTYSGGVQDDEGASENVLRLWDMNAMQENPKKRGVILPYYGEYAAQYPGAYSYFYPVFSPNNEWVYTYEQVYNYELRTLNPVLHYTPTSIEVLKERACQAVGRNFIINEWERFFPDDPYRKTCENLPEHPSVAVP